MINQVKYKYVKLNIKQQLMAMAVGALIAYTMSYVIYKQMSISLVFAIFGSVYGVFYYRRYLSQKHDQQVLLQFNDLLESLFNSYSVGKNTLDSFKTAKDDLLYQHSKNTLVYQEVARIVSGLEHGYSMEELLNHFSQQVNAIEIHDFVSIFNNVYRTGGNLKALMLQSKELVSKKIATQLEILTIIHEQKQQVMILLAMPYVLLMMMEWFGLSVSTKAIGVSDLIARTIALILFAVGYMMARIIVEKIG